MRQLQSGLIRVYRTLKENNMVHGNVRKLAFLTTAMGTLIASQAMAADLTDVLDAADEVYLGNELVSDPFDISLTPKFSQRHEWAKLKREYYEGKTKQMRLLNELEYKRVVNEFDIDLEIGMFHDLSFRMGIPIIISDQASYKFDTSSDKPEFQINKTNSWFSPDHTDTNRPYRFFDLNEGETLKGRDRSGLGDMTFGIAWSPYNTERHFIPERPWEGNTGRSTVTLAFDYKAPTGKMRKIDNSSAGNGAHELIFSVAASHRFAFVDPYIRLQYGLPIGTDSAYPEYGANQTRVDPGMWGRIDLGIEFIPYESIAKDFQRFVKIDLRGYFKYTGEGRAYSELADAFGKGNCYQTDGKDSACAWVSNKWSNAGADNIASVANGTYTGMYKEDGLFDYEGFGAIGGALNLTIQPIQYISIIAGVAVDYEQNHFITFTKLGKDRHTFNKTGQLTDEGQKDGLITENAIEERNPTYSKALDAVGSRIKRVESVNLEWFVGLKLMY